MTALHTVQEQPNNDAVTQSVRALKHRDAQVSVERKHAGIPKDYTGICIVRYPKVELWWTVFTFALLVQQQVKGTVRSPRPLIRANATSVETRQS